MSITNMYGKYGQKQVECDNCGGGFMAADWDEAQLTMKADGWKQKVIDGHWQHFCPDCVEE